MNEFPSTGANGDDAAFQAVLTERRRRIVRFLHGRESETASLDALAAHLAGGDDSPADDGGDRGRVLIELHHADVPKLAAADVVDYDPASRTVRYLGDPEVERLLEV